MLFSPEYDDREREIKYRDLGYRTLSKQERVDLYEAGVPLNTYGNDWRIKGQVAVNDVVHGKIILDDQDNEVELVECGWGPDFLDRSPVISVDSTMAELALNYFLGGDIEDIVALCNYNNQPPLVNKKIMNDELSFYEHQLFASDQVSRPYITAFNPSAGTVKRMKDHNLKPKFLFSITYFNSEYVQDTVLDRIRTLFYAAELKDMYEVVNHDDIVSTKKNHCYYGRNANLVSGKPWSHAFEFNPYSSCAKEEEKIIGIVDTPTGYRVTYEAGEEKVQYEYNHNVDFFRMNESSFIKLMKCSQKFIYKRNDVYVYCTTIPSIVLSTSLVLEESLIVFSDPIQLPKLVSAEIPVEQASKRYHDVLRRGGREKLKVMICQEGDLFSVVDISCGLTYSSRRYLIDLLFDGMVTYDTINCKWLPGVVESELVDTYISPIDPYIISGVELSSFDITEWGQYSPNVLPLYASNNTADVLYGAVVTEDGVLDIVETDYVKKLDERWFIMKTLVYNFNLCSRGNGSYIDTRDIFCGNKFGD